MAQQEHLPDAALTGRVDTELRMIADAVELVRMGAAARVTLGGLQFGDQLLIQARTLAQRAGLRVVPVYATDEIAGTDLVIEHPDTDEGAR